MNSSKFNNFFKNKIIKQYDKKKKTSSFKKKSWVRFLGEKKRAIMIGCKTILASIIKTLL
jgi:hypothetical protein